MDRQPTSISELRRQVRALFSPSGDASARLVGAEMELLVLDRRALGGHGVVPLERLRAILATDPSLAADAHFSFEPGGQLELSPAPAATPRRLSANLRRLVSRTDALLARHGIATASLPVDPWRTADELGLQTPADRYQVMQRHFDSIGPAGRQMMRRTASLQICVDLLPGRAGRQQWLLGNLAAPALAMAFGRPAEADETRLAIWQRADPSRTGYDGTQVDGVHPTAAYASFALAAKAMPLPREEDLATDLPVRTWFEDWVRRDAARPDPRDVAHHLSTLFPPVRPRGDYLEIRFVDAQPFDWLDVPISVLATLLIDDRAREAGLEVVGQDPYKLAAWWRSAATGDDASLRAFSLDLFDIAARRGRSSLAVWLPPGAPDIIDAYADGFLRRRPVACSSTRTTTAGRDLLPVGGPA